MLKDATESRFFWTLVVLPISCLCGCGDPKHAKSPSTSSSVQQQPLPTSKPPPQPGVANWISGTWDDPETAEFSAEGNLLLAYKSDLGDAQMITNELLARSKTSSDDDFRRLLVIINEQARQFHSIGMTETAFDIAERSLEQTKRRNGEGVETAFCRGVLGELYRAEGDLVTAEKMLSDAPDVQQTEPEAYGLLTTLTSLGELYLALGEESQAETMLEDAHRIVRYDRNPNRIAILTNLAEIFIRKGDLERKRSATKGTRHTAFGASVLHVPWARSDAPPRQCCPAAFQLVVRVFTLWFLMGRRSQDRTVSQPQTDLNRCRVRKAVYHPGSPRRPDSNRDSETRWMVSACAVPI